MLESEDWKRRQSSSKCSGNNIPDTLFPAPLSGQGVKEELLSVSEYAH